MIVAGDLGRPGLVIMTYLRLMGHDPAGRALIVTVSGPAEGVGTFPSPGVVIMIRVRPCPWTGLAWTGLALDRAGLGPGRPWTGLA